MKWQAIVFLGLLGSFSLAGLTQAGWVQAGEIAYTVRPTELKARPFSDAVTLARLEQRTKVEVIGRRSSWRQVQVDGKAGWVKMLSLKFNHADRKTGDTGLATLFNVATTGSTGSSVTTGVRGLSEDDLKNTKPNPKALEVMDTYSVSKSEAQQFAKVGKLSPQSMGYIAEPASGARR
ncbi:MAG: hypothetical protein ABL860_01510 [Candidatus Nitrotoga sp.]